MSDKPYIEVEVRKIIRKYNPEYGNDRICVCGHPYHRHFDSYEGMDPVGCKYCGCNDFVEAASCQITQDDIKKILFAARDNPEMKYNVEKAVYDAIQLTIDRVIERVEVGFIGNIITLDELKEEVKKIRPVPVDF